MTTRIIDRGDNAAQYYSADSATEFDLYDILLHDTDDVKAADGTETAPKFAGLAGGAKVAGEATEDQRVLPDVVVEMECTSATWEVGDLVQIAGPTSLVKTTTDADAVGYCVRRAGTATTTVRARLISNVTPN